MRPGILVTVLASAVVLAGCGGAPAATDASSTTAPASSSPTSSSASPSQEPSRSEEPTPEATPSATADAVLTATSSKEFAALLAVRDNCDESIAAFATKHAGATIEFDGSISAMMNHEDYDTRFDIGIAPGDRGSSSSRGPFFKYENVNLFDLHFPDADIPYVGTDEKFRFVATVGEYVADTCLFYLSPVSTRSR